MRHELGIDLREYVRGDRPWSQFYRFLARLPGHGQFHASVRSDEDSVAALVDAGGIRSSIPLAGWSTEHDLLATVIDVLNNIHATLVQVNSDGGKRPDVKPMARPVTALDRVEARRAVEEHQERVRMFRPVE